jgi:Zn-dependent protease with chaperone function
MATKNDLDVPRRDQLLAKFESANRWGIALLLLQIIGIAGLAFLIDWKQAQQQTLLTTIAIAAVVGPFAMSILTMLVSKRKEIGDLQEQTRFGEFDKHKLRKLFDDTLRRLGLPNYRIPVYIVADKFTNAMVLHLGMGFIFRSLNGVYLNRQALHKLNADELQDIIGHELGHYYRYYLVADRFRIVSLILGVLLSIFVVQFIGLGDGILGWVALSVCIGAVWKLVHLPQAINSWTIEYLCDDLGAQVHGVCTSVSGLMKLGAEAELLTRIQREAILSMAGNNLNVHEIVEAIEKALPYGHASQEEISKSVEKAVRDRAQQGGTIGGFLRYAWQSDADAENDAEAEEEMRKLKKLDSIPRLPWESLMAHSGEIRFDETSLEKLVGMILQYPDHVLFRTSDALKPEASHPPLKQRILYLWNNRREIESSHGRF